MVNDELSPRELEIVGGVVVGLTNAQIADRLGIARGTVTSHVEGIRRKLGLRNRLQVAVWAVRHGLDPLPR